MIASPRNKYASPLAFCVLFAAALVYYALRPIDHDVAWFMYAARGLLHGGTLYRDYVDVNAPLAYFTLIPAAALSELPIFSNEAALALNILIYVAIGFALSVAVLRRLGLPPNALLAVETGLLIILCFMPHEAFGQREHLLAILTLPYALAAGFRGSTGRKLPNKLAIACGIAAGVAASIKLPYLVVPLVIEAAVFLRGKCKIAFTPDLVAMAASVVTVNILCFALYPDYWTEILPEAASLYGPYDNFTFLSDALLLQAPLFAVAFLIGEYRGRLPLAGARWMMAAACIGAFALFIAQRKGWPHHALPILMFMAALCVLHIADFPIQYARQRSAALIRCSLAAAAFLCAFFLAVIGGNVDPGMADAVKQNLQGTNGSFWILSTGNYPAFPIALDRRTRWTSRFPQLILLPGLAEAALKGEASPYEPGFRKALDEDFISGKPATVFLYSPQDAGMPPDFDMLGWMRRDPAFEKEWRHYRQTGSGGPFTIFKRMEQD